MLLALQSKGWRACIGFVHSAGRKEEQLELERQEKARHLLDVYGTSILRFAYSYVRNMADAQDIVQEVLLKALYKAPAFHSAGAEKAWLLQVTANESRNRLRFNKRHASTSLDLLQDVYLKEDPDLRCLWQAVAQLGPEDQSVIHLFYEEDYSTAQIAAILKVSDSAVRSRLSRARARLKTILQQEDLL